MTRRSLVVALTLTLTGCAAISPAQVGQTAGTIAGAVIAPGIGAPLGAMVGMLAGMVLQGQVDQVTATRERQELGNQLARGAAPAAGGTAAGPPGGTPSRVWVDETFHDGRLIAGHFDTRVIP